MTETVTDRSRRRWPIRVMNGACAAAQRLGFAGARIEAGALLDAARRKTGLTDFGHPELIEPLGRIVDSYNREARLSPLGRVVAMNNLLRLLTIRLRFEEAWKRNPAVAEEPIERPIFISGLPRSGTTLLHNLISRDPEVRAPLTWETMNPRLDGVASEKSDRARAAAARRQLRWLDRLAPEFAAIHPVGATLPEECISITGFSLVSPVFHTMHWAPSFAAWLGAADHEPAYRFHRRFLQWLQAGDRAAGRLGADGAPRRWALKAPAHLFGLAALFRVYPDALFVQSHRDPLEVLASVSSLSASLQHAFSDFIDPAAIGREVADRWLDGVERSMRIREFIAPDQVCDVRYGEIVRDPIGIVARVYAHFGLALSEAAKDRMKAMPAERPWKIGAHRYSLEQFHLDPGEQRERFAPYCRFAGVASPDPMPHAAPAARPAEPALHA